MIRRLLLALLVFCLAIPAMAAPLHCLPQQTAAMAMPAHHGHHGPAPVASGASHDCIGCIAPYSGLPEPARAPALFAVKPIGFALHMLDRGAATPETPPPRS